ncbi:ankyrin repeat and protein kinase domain-containing protein 1 [Pseudoliparis swirei]|uniref:ankyrin repeat and protein kinase domain-containing protein 1 n=1 Tax=Pseudoliparis swirei TaxID=2059687 RepID=UPI0024BDE173|nr:ankyrin repeat and protein kinase domain-containing protein 1 [Pseudoliparis swirei]
MDCLDGFAGQFRNFKKDDFEADWIKVAECRFGHLHRVKLKNQQKSCALKSFDKTLCANNLYRRIIDEAPKIATLQFEYLVSIYGLCSEATAVVMEYMSHGSLNDLLTSHTLMWPKKFQMIHEASMGMNFLHSLKPPLLHLNLKTSNILLDDCLHVKISDFGVIHWEESTCNTLFMEHLTARGNINYIPPEAFTQCPDPPGTAFDVYSFGIVMWEILTQQKPYAGSRMTTVLLQVSHGKRPCVEMIPERKPQSCEQMIGIMRQCWDQDRRKRPEFSDTVRKTRSLSEGLKLQGPIHMENGDEGHTPDHERPGSDSILSLLYKKEFASFRHSVKRDHVRRQFPSKKSLLHYTVASGDAESVEHVLRLGAEVNCTTAGGYTPLLVAVMHSLHGIILLLLDRGASATLADEELWTALHFAAQSGDDRTVRLLLDNGAAAEAQETNGWTALHLACQNGHETVVRLLLSRLSEEAAGEREAKGRTPLHLAAAHGHLSIAKLLLSHGADPKATDRSLSTALHVSAEKGHNRVVRRLVQSEADVDGADSRGYTPLHLAALKAHTGICRQLLARGARPDRRTLRGWTPMHLAALRGHVATVVQLESQGGRVNAAGEDGWTPLHLACHRGEPETVAALLAAKADPNAPEDGKGWTPLHVACASASYSSVLHLVSHHADVNAVNSGKVTPLHLAAQHGCVSIAKALLLHGADGALLDSSGTAALNVAQRCEKWEIVQLLEKLS